MPSPFGNIFGYYSQSFDQTHASDEAITYKDDYQTVELTNVIIRTVDTKEIITEEREGEARTVELVIRKSQLDNPRLKATYEFFGSKWQQTVLDGQGINSESETFVTVTVRKVGVSSIGHPNRRREAQ